MNVREEMYKKANKLCVQPSLFGGWVVGGEFVSEEYECSCRMKDCIHVLALQIKKGKDITVTARRSVEDGVTKIDGWTKSAWASLAVKSTRLGWPNGLREAEKRLTEKYMTATLICGVFEDIFPLKDELEGVLDEIKRRDYTTLCRRETHHGQGLSDEFCDLEKESVAASQDERSWLYAKAREFGFSMSPRMGNVFYTWLHIAKESGSMKREIDGAEWVGMPDAMLDMHTYEGKVRRTFNTILSGSYKQHRRLGKMVQKYGWGYIREEVHKE